MSDATATVPTSQPSRARLWLGVALAPAAWSVAEVVGYIGAGRGCWGNWPNGRTVGPSNSDSWVVVIAGLALIAAVVGLGIAIHSYRQTSPDRPTGTRAHFMAVFGVGASALFLGGIVLFVLPPLILHGCVATR